MTLNELIEKNTLYLEKVNDNLIQVTIPDLSFLGEFIDMNEFNLIYGEIKKFILTIIEELKRIIEKVITGINLVANEITQLSSVQKFINLLFTTAKRIATTFTNLGVVMGVENLGTASLDSFVDGADQANAFIVKIFNELPASEVTALFVNQLETLKVRITNLSNSWPNLQLQ